MKPSVLILGNPNSGKSLLFNRLTGLRQKVANFPGVTVEIRSGDGDGECEALSFVDFPGVYSLIPLTKDETVAIENFRFAISDDKTSLLLYVLDATRLERSLYLLLQLLPEAANSKKPILVAVNIIDEVLSKGANVDTAGLAKELGIPMLPVSARTQQGISELRATLLNFNSSFQNIKVIPTDLVATKQRAKDLAKRYGPSADVILRSQQKLDQFFLSSFGGPLVFFALMFLVFQSIFTGAAPIMKFLSESLGKMGLWVATQIPSGIFADFINDALFKGVGSVVVFVPQIFILFLFIGILEDSGYLARAAILCHRPLSLFGLSGKSFVPLLSGHACAIPAMMAARTIESPRKRFITLMAIPFMTCSARLPVYALLIGAFIPAAYQGLSFLGMYLLGIFAGLLVSGLASKTLKKTFDDAPFIVELPPYRRPNVKPILRQSFERSKSFLKKAGGIIFAVAVIVWFLGYVPHGSGHLDESWLAWIGKKIEPIFQLMGADWKIGVALLSSFLAREVFVGTLGTLLGMSNGSDDTDLLGNSLKSAGITLPTAVAILIFFALSLQCISTVAVMRKEMGSTKIPIVLYVGYTVVAYGISVAVYQLIV